MEHVLRKKSLKKVSLCYSSCSWPLRPQCKVFEGQGLKIKILVLIIVNVRKKKVFVVRELVEKSAKFDDNSQTEFFHDKKTFFSFQNRMRKYWFFQSDEEKKVVATFLSSLFSLTCNIWSKKALSCRNYSLQFTLLRFAFCLHHIFHCRC